MTKKECFSLGYIAKRVGNKGELGFKLDVDYPERYQKLESVFVEINNSLVPFFISRIRISGKNATVTIEGIDTIERAEELIKSSLYLPLSFLPPLQDKKFYFHEIAGYAVSDKVYGAIGIIENVLDFPQQVIFQIKKGEQEILIPAKEEFIVSIDREKKQIFINAPEGLIAIYIDNNDIDNSEKETDEE